MKPQALFNLVVLGGVALGSASSCSSSEQNSGGTARNPTANATPPVTRVLPDGGTEPEDRGGGAPGW
jgi:hypothetical protein